MAGCLSLKGAWESFCVANEVSEVRTSFEEIRELTSLTSLFGLDFYGSLKKDVTKALNYKQRKIFQTLDAAIELRAPFQVDRETRVVISGAGPVGLRGAVECALLGQNVTILEKRATFSRVNILLLWQQTMDDLVSLGAKYFYPLLKVHGDPLHLGTREIQLTLVKISLLLGVNVRYETQLEGLKFENNAWNALSREINGEIGSQSVTGFKLLKTDDYRMTYHCNAMDEPNVSEEFITGETASDNPEKFPFDALLIAEGEWSPTCRYLGVKKSVDKFKQAIGLVVNMEYNKKNKKEVGLLSFQASVLSPLLGKLLKAGLICENIEYLKGSTHYIVVTIHKSSLIEKGVLIEDFKTSKKLLASSNLNLQALQELARNIASIVGIPEEAVFCQTNPIQIFDFSSRARALQAFCVLDANSVDVKETLGKEKNFEGLAPVFPIGDSLLEPFWPQSLGSNRGFHSAVDSALVCSFLGRGLILLEVLCERAFAYGVMNSYTWSQRGHLVTLTPQKEWTTDYMTRYGRHCIKAAVDICDEKNIRKPTRLKEMTSYF